MNISISYFGPAREAVGADHEVVEIPEGMTVGRLLEWLGEERPPLGRLIGSCRVAVGTRYAPSDEVIESGSELALIPPVAGG